MKRPPWPVVATLTCRCYISGSAAAIVTTCITCATDPHNRAGIEALWPWIVGWSIAGVPIALIARTATFQIGVLACAFLCFALGLLAWLPELASAR